MLDKFTFGNNPASLYLTETLNLIDNKKLNRKITNLIRESRTTLGELISANEAGKLSTHTVSLLVELLREKVEMAAYLMKFDIDGAPLLEDPGCLAVNLATNVIKGELKSLHRRARTVHHLEKGQQRHASKVQTNEATLGGIVIGKQITKFEPRKIAVKEVTETITAETLTNKSKAKLARLNKPCKLY